MAKTPIIIIGGGGHGLSVADVILADERYQLLGYIDHKDNSDLSKVGVPWLGDDSVILKTGAQAAHIGVGQIKSPTVREALFNNAMNAGLSMPVLSSRSSTISRSATLDNGVLVMHHAAVNSKASIGLNTIINTAAIVEHGAMIGDHSHIAPRATVLGNAKVGHRSFIGAGVIIREGIEIGNNTVIGAGAVIKYDIGNGVTVKGPSCQ